VAFVGFSIVVNFQTAGSRKIVDYQDGT